MVARLPSFGGGRPPIWCVFSRGLGAQRWRSSAAQGGSGADRGWIVFVFNASVSSTVAVRVSSQTLATLVHDQTVTLRSSAYREMAGVPLALGAKLSSRLHTFHLTVRDLVALAKASRRPVVGRVVDRPDWAVGHSDPVPAQDQGCQASGGGPFAYDEDVKRVGTAFAGIDYVGEVRCGAVFVRVFGSCVCVVVRCFARLL